MDQSDVTERYIKIFIATFFVTMIALCFIYAAGREAKDTLEFVSYICPCGAGVCAGAGLYFRRSPLKKNLPDKVPGQVDPAIQVSQVEPRPEQRSPNGQQDQAEQVMPSPDHKKISTDAEHQRRGDYADEVTRKTKLWPPKEKGFYAISVALLFVGLLAYVFGHANCQLPAVAVIGVALSSTCAWIFNARLVGDGSAKKKFLYVDGIFWAILIPVLPFIIIFCFWKFSTFFIWFDGALKCAK